MIENMDWDARGSVVTTPASTGLDSWRAGFAVRRDWPDGAHEFVGFRTAEPDADRFVDADRNYWRRGPLRPGAWSVVVISRRDFELHAVRLDCHSPDCPMALATVCR